MDLTSQRFQTASPEDFSDESTSIYKRTLGFQDADRTMEYLEFHVAAYDAMIAAFHASLGGNPRAGVMLQSEDELRMVIQIDNETNHTFITRARKEANLIEATMCFVWIIGKSGVAKDDSFDPETIRATALDYHLCWYSEYVDPISPDPAGKYRYGVVLGEGGFIVGHVEGVVNESGKSGVSQLLRSIMTERREASE